MTHRPIWLIAREIRDDWGANRVNYAARPYLEAMSSLAGVGDRYGFDSATSIVLYFLGNARSYRGETARRLKAELKAIVGVK